MRRLRYREELKRDRSLSGRYQLVIAYVRRKRQRRMVRLGGMEAFVAGDRPERTSRP